MTTNVGNADRIARLALGIVLFILPFAAGLGTLLTVLSILVGLVMVGTAATRSCPIYSVLGLKTCRS